MKAATGEEVTPEELGGADVHCRTSGVTDHYAEDDTHAIEITRSIIRNLNVKPKSLAKLTDQPLYPIEEIYGIIEKDSRKSYDPREIISRLVDGSRF